MGVRPGSPEKEFQRTIVETLELFGYVGTHLFPLRDIHGQMRTPSTASGWPDLVYLRPPRVLAIEVKGDTGKADPKQIAWLSLWANIPCARAWLVRPSDPPWNDLLGWIRRPAQAPMLYGFTPIADPAPAIKRRKRGTIR
jgi:hypothetical protein